MPRTAPVSDWDYGQASHLVDEVPPELVDRANLAIANCPEYAIASLGD
jgi:ferredoxin